MARATESWSSAFTTFAHEVMAEMPDSDEAEQYAEYRRRCVQWKHDNGMNLTPEEVKLLSVPPPADSGTSGINGRCDRPCAPGHAHERDCVNYFDPLHDSETGQRS